MRVERAFELAQKCLCRIELYDFAFQWTPEKYAAIADPRPVRYALVDDFDPPSTNFVPWQHARANGPLPLVATLAEMLRHSLHPAMRAIILYYDHPHVTRHRFLAISGNLYWIPARTIR